MTSGMGAHQGLLSATAVRYIELAGHGLRARLTPFPGAPYHWRTVHLSLGLRMVLDGLKARLERLLAEHGERGDPRAYAAQLHEAMVDTKVGIGTMREALQATERELGAERKNLEDAERRGKLAASIADRETAEIAERFGTKHRERIALLERKLPVQRDELAMAERQLEEMGQAYRSARMGVARGPAAPVAGLEGDDTELLRDLDSLKTKTNRDATQAAIQAQLAHLKSKLGKRP